MRLEDLLFSLSINILRGVICFTTIKEQLDWRMPRKPLSHYVTKHARLFLVFFLSELSFDINVQEAWEIKNCENFFWFSVDVVQ